jgi:CRISPR/Cas system-associated exonuclease Cas4 (RecB family)
MKKQVRGGNSGYIQNGIVYSDSPQACLRRILLRHHGIQEEITEKTQKVFNIGFLNEEEYAKNFTEGTSDFKCVVPINDATEFAGSVDFVQPDGTPEEHKSITSLNTHKLVFDNNLYKFDNLVQLANYMTALESPKGELVYTSYTEAVNYKEIDSFTYDEIKEKILSITPKVKRYFVTIDDSGRFSVDKKPLDLYVENIIDFWKEAANVLEHNIVYPNRPETKKKFGSSCDFCPLKGVCSDWEKNPTTTDDFLRSAEYVFKS